MNFLQTPEGPSFRAHLKASFFAKTFPLTSCLHGEILSLDCALNFVIAYNAYHSHFFFIKTCLLAYLILRVKNVLERMDLIIHPASPPLKFALFCQLDSQQ